MPPPKPPKPNVDVFAGACEVPNKDAWFCGCDWFCVAFDPKRLVEGAVGCVEVEPKTLDDPDVGWPNILVVGCCC